MYLTIGQVAQRLKCQSWQVRRLYERGLLPPAQRLGKFRVIPENEIFRVERALREAGYLGVHTTIVAEETNG